MYIFLKEGFGLLSLWWHAVTARVIFCWIVRKWSVNRLEGRRTPYLVASLAAVVTAIRLILWQTVKDNDLGLRIGNVLYDYIMVPVPIVLLFYYNMGSIKALGDADKKQQEQQQQRGTNSSFSGATQRGHSFSRDLGAGNDGFEASRANSNLDSSRHSGSGSQCRASSHDEEGGNAPGGLVRTKTSGVNTRNRVIIARLLRVSVVVTVMWIWIVGYVSKLV